jgi:hypothetical protein
MYIKFKIYWRTVCSLSGITLVDRTFIKIRVAKLVCECSVTGRRNIGWQAKRWRDKHPWRRRSHKNLMFCKWHQWTCTKVCFMFTFCRLCTNVGQREQDMFCIGNDFVYCFSLGWYWPVSFAVPHFSYTALLQLPLLGCDICRQDWEKLVGTDRRKASRSRLLYRKEIFWMAWNDNRICLFK